MKEEKRIYVVIPATVEVPVATYEHNGKHFVNFQKGARHVVQPAGRQIAQACHVVSKLRFLASENKVEPTEFQPLTTIILAARDSKEMMHGFLALQRRKLKPVLFSDENEGAYGNFKPITALAVLASSRKVRGILDYLPLWGS